MYLTSFGILSLLIGVLVRGIVGSCKTSENDTACPFGCCCNAEQYYVACNGKKFTKIPVGIPKDIKMLRFSNNILTNITSMVFESFQALETLNLNDNNIVSISTNAFANLKSLKTLDLSGNILIQFPWKSLLNLPKLQSLYLERNKLYDLPNEENILNRLGGLMHLSVYANPFLCSCKLLNFSSWLQHNLRATKSAGSVNVVKHETLKCTSRYGLVSYLLPYVNATGVYKSKCVKPDAKIFAGNISDDYLIKFGQTAITRSLEIYPSMATIYLHHNSSALVTCKSGSDDGDLMTAYFYNKTDGGSSFICVAENFAGTSFLEARLIEEKPKYFTQLLDGLDAITSEVQATLQPTRSDGTFYSNRNATSRQNELGVKKIRSQCAIGFNASVTILSPALELPLTYRYNFTNETQATIKLEDPLRGAIKVLIEEMASNKFMAQLCRIWQDREFEIVSRHNINRVDNDLAIKDGCRSCRYVICLFNEAYPTVQVCANFTLTSSNLENDMLVVWIVGGFFMSLSFIPPLLCVLQNYNLLDKKSRRRGVLRCNEHKSTNDFPQYVEQEEPLVPRNSSKTNYKNLSLVGSCKLVSSTMGNNLGGESSNPRDSVQVWLNQLNHEEWSMSSDASL
ncbi:uncharacterized protein LOC143469788 isoform X1 [Clavelina lepadiformis]|uniref:uncharacterized protein LOC143469788 isoform X1 n=1 Tax=Clavelina lepadiformis TaxID=159417 RepID=UPI00404257E3